MSTEPTVDARYVPDLMLLSNGASIRPDRIIGIVPLEDEHGAQVRVDYEYAGEHTGYHILPRDSFTSAHGYAENLRLCAKRLMDAAR